MKPLNQTLGSYGTTIFTVMTQLADEVGAINLGQGFPDVDGPDWIKQAAARAMVETGQQYPPMAGIPKLRQAVAGHAQRFYGLDLDWASQTVITAGATEALAAAALAFINPGDEVVIIEPAYDSYAPMIERAGGTIRSIVLEPPAFALTDEAMDAAFTPRTAAIFLNNPQNPCGKVYSRDELERLTTRIHGHDAVAVCDEVYEHIVFDGREHIPLMTLPGMAERSVRIGSAGKTFSMTGWKVGYAMGAADLIAAMSKAHQFLTFTVPPMLQSAVAEGLCADRTYFAGLTHEMQAKRDRLVNGLSATSLTLAPTAGTYFLTAELPASARDAGDSAFCETITREAGVTALPFSAFYRPETVRQFPDVAAYIRFCFCKRDEILDEAARRLREYLNTPSGAA